MHPHFADGANVPRRCKWAWARSDSDGCDASPAAVTGILLQFCSGTLCGRGYGGIHILGHRGCHSKYLLSLGHRGCYSDILGYPW